MHTQIHAKAPDDQNLMYFGILDHHEFELGLPENLAVVLLELSGSCP